MNVTVTALIENRSDRPELACEFGLSLLVEAGKRRILFDAGSSGAFLDNAAALGLDLAALDAVVLSHGHIDHCRGLCRLVEEGLSAPLYVHRDFFTDRYWDKAGGEGYYEPTSSGLDAAWLVRHGVRWRALARDLFQPFPGEEIYLMSNAPRTCPFEPIDPTDLVFTGGQFRPDDYRDELGLVVRGEEGLVLITGCAHTGLVNLCTHAQRLLGLPVLAYVGGTHLAPSPVERAARTAAYVNGSAIRTLAPCHCTGPEALALFRRDCPTFVPFSTGCALSLTV